MLSDGNNKITNLIFLDIPKAACLSFNQVQNLIQKCFQTREQQFVQRSQGLLSLLLYIFSISSHISPIS